jgi:hypothetical protein
MSSRKRTILAMLHLAAVMLFAAPVLAADAPAIDPRADQILKATANYLKEAKEFVFHAEITIDDILPSGPMIQYSGSLKAGVRRPDKARSLFSGDLRNSSSWYDGKTFTMLNKNLNLYAQWPAPSKLDSTMDKLQEKLGVTLPLSSLYYSDPYKRWMDGALVVIYAGEHFVNGQPTHHIIMVQEDVDAQVWIHEGKQLVLRKVVLTYKNVPGNPQFTAMFSNWDFSPRLSDLLFSFSPPKGADKIEFLPASQ